MRSSEKVMLLSLRESWQQIYVYAGPQESVLRVNIDSMVAITDQPRIAILLADEQIGGLAVVRRRQRSGAFDQLIEIADLYTLDSPIGWNDFQQAFQPGKQSHLRLALHHNGVVPPKTAEAALEQLESTSPGVANWVAEKRIALSISVENTTPSRVTQKEQRDAVALGLEFAGIDSREALVEVEHVDDAPFLRNLKPSTTQEAATVRHDIGRFSDWLPIDTEAYDVWRYVDPVQPDRRVTVLYADKNPLEELTGTDLIYYREETDSFVLVQYKRMKYDGSSRIALYRPDKQLDVEIERMRKLELPAPLASNVKEARLSSDPFYIKLVEPDLKRPEGNRLAKGMYFPLDLFQLLREDPGVRGPKGGVAIGWDNASRYISNTQFINLVKEAWIGTRGAASTLLSTLIRGAIENKRGVVIVSDETDHDRVSSRRP